MRAQAFHPSSCLTCNEHFRIAVVLFKAPVLLVILFVIISQAIANNMRIDGREVVPVSCNICGTRHNKILWRKDGFTYRRCSLCGLVYISPRLTENQISKIYYTIYESKAANKPPPVDFSTYTSFFSNASRYRKRNTFLDVGCFRGDLLVGARQHGWNVYGTELSEKPAAFAKENYGLDIHVGSLLSARFKDDFFDVVSLFDVIEHLCDPASYLTEIRRILRPGGFLYITTPNFDSFNRLLLSKQWTVFFPWHLFYFTAHTLRRLLSDCGLNVFTVTSEGFTPISRHNPYKSLNTSDTDGKSIIDIKTWLKPYRKQLKPLYVIAKECCSIPFRVLSKNRVTIGSKLLSLAEKPKSKASNV